MYISMSDRICVKKNQLSVAGDFNQCLGINRLLGEPSGTGAGWWTGLPQTPTQHPLHFSVKMWCTPVSLVYSERWKIELGENSSGELRTLRPVVHTCNLRRRDSIGMTLRMGSSTTRHLGLLFTRQPCSQSQSAPSRYRPDTKQPVGEPQ